MLCDIGNTSYHFLDGEFLDGEDDFKKDVESFNPSEIEKKVYYISVNHKISRKLSNLKNWINLEPYVEREKYYKTMGIDRIVALEMIENGIIIDAGSAITVDVKKNGVFEGGFIYPGVRFMQQTYENISQALTYSFNFELNLDKMPKNSQDAISYGFLGTLYREVMQHNLPVILTGGDAKLLAKIFPNAKINETLLFDAMKKIIKEAQLC